MNITIYIEYSITINGKNALTSNATIDNCSTAVGRMVFGGWAGWAESMARIASAIDPYEDPSGDPVNKLFFP